MPAVHSKPKQSVRVKQTDKCTEHNEFGCAICGSSVLAALIKAGEQVKIVGELECVYFSSIDVPEAHQSQGRGLHLNSVVDKSIRKNGWDYSRGSNMRLIEKPWTVEAWEAEISSARVPSGTERPVLLRLSKWAIGPNGTARITAPDMKHRRFVLDDGNHRTNAMQNMIAEKHKRAILICERGCVLLDCDPEEDKDKMIFSSIAANNKHKDIDPDFLADKIGQIKMVRVFCFGLDCPSSHSSHPNTNTNC
jgi:hypothetical protein